MRRYFLPALFSLAGIGAAAALLLTAEADYVSRATVRMRPAVVSDRFVPGTSGAATFNVLHGVRQITLARAAQTALMDTYAVYPDERSTRPLEDLLEKLRKHLTVVERPEGVVEISFAHPDPHKAQKVVSDIVTRYLDIARREYATQLDATRRLLEEQASEAWNVRINVARARPSDANRLELEAVSRRYIELTNQITELNLLNEASKRGLTPSLELVEPANLPDERDDTWRYAAAVACPLVGLSISLILLLRGRSRRAPLLEPAEA